MTEIRPELLRSIARQHIRDAVDNIDHGDVLDGLLTDARFAHLMVGDEDDDIATLDPIAAEIKDEIKAATVTTAWPDEQAGPTVGQLRHIIDEQAHRIQSGLDRIAELEAERDNDLCVMAAFLRPTRRSTAEWHAILANHFEARANALLRDDARFAAARARVEGGV